MFLLKDILLLIFLFPGIILVSYILIYMFRHIIKKCEIKEEEKIFRVTKLVKGTLEFSIFELEKTREEIKKSYNPNKVRIYSRHINMLKTLSEIFEKFI